MKIRLEFEDTNALTSQEIEKGLKMSYGENAKVEVLPHNNSPQAHIYFGLQNLLTPEHMELFFEFYPHLYPDKLEELKNKYRELFEVILDRVIKDNESRVNE